MSTCPTCGSSTPAKARSSEQHRRYFKILALAFEHWPEKSGTSFDSAEDLRAFCQMKAGHYTTIRVDLNNADPAQAVIVAQASMRAAGSYARARIINDELVIFKPKSIRFDSLSQDAFNKLSAEVESVIEAESGLKAEDLLKESGDHAGHRTKSQGQE